MRKFFIGKTGQEANKTFIVLLEDSGNGVLIEPSDKPLDKLQGGEKEIKKICVELYNFFKKEQKKNQKELNIKRMFTVSNLPSEMLTVDNDSGLMFLSPLSWKEMQTFCDTYCACGKYR